MYCVYICMSFRRLVRRVYRELYIFVLPSAYEILLYTKRSFFLFLSSLIVIVNLLLLLLEEVEW